MSDSGSASQFEESTRRWRLQQPLDLTHWQKPLPFGSSHGTPGLGFSEIPPVLMEEAAPADLHAKFGKFAKRVPTGQTKPLQRVYRGMSHDEWNEAQQRGFIHSDGRGALFPEWEGTNAGYRHDSAKFYLEGRPTSGTGVIAHIDVHPDDGWFATDADEYLRTRRKIPLSRVSRVEHFKDGQAV